MARPRRTRTARRELERRLGKVGDAGERAFLQGPGGSPERPLLVETPAVIEVRARSTPCPRCGGEHDVIEHRAVTVEGSRLREIRISCKACRTSRSLWFTLPILN